MSNFDQAIQKHIHLYKEGMQDKYYQGAKWAWQHQQTIIDDLKTQLNNMEACYIQMKKERDELQGRIDEISTYATELAEYASYAEIIGAVSHNRSAIREYCDKVFAYNRAIDIEEEKALRGEHE